MNKVALFAILGTAMFLLSGATAFAATPSSTPVHIQPNPTVNVNVTWSSFNSSWGELEYSNETGFNNLSAQPSTIYRNPISVNPTDIIAPGTLQNDKTGSIYWGNTSEWVWSGGNTNTNQTKTISQTTENGISQINLIDNVTGNVSYYPWGQLSIPITDYASQNPAYDFVTTIAELSAPTNSHASLGIRLANQTIPAQIGTALPNQPIAVEHTLTNLAARFNTTAGSGYSDEMNLQVTLVLPDPTVTGTYKITVYAFSMTTYPLSYGTNSTGQTVTNATGDLHLTTFKPSFPYKGVQNGGYTVAVSQTLQNLTTTQTPISSGNYIEQVEYQGLFDLPTAPDLSYGPANLTEAFNLSTSQTQVLDINGVSYLSEISGKNGTIQLLASVNPNQPTQFLQIVDYTQSQWNSISVAPGIFTIAGIEYYWWIAVGGLATLIGLAAAAKHAGTKADQERIRRGR